jgi:ribosomal protein RSM22 (predicted rRNA methylase)
MHLDRAEIDIEVEQIDGGGRCQDPETDRGQRDPEATLEINQTIRPNKTTSFPLFTFINQMTNLNIIQWNCQSVRNKKDVILELIENHEIDVLAVQETKLKETINYYSISNYNYLRRDSNVNYTTHWGVAFYIHSSIPYSHIELDVILQ